MMRSFLFAFLFLTVSSGTTWASNEDLLKTIVSRAAETESDSLVIIQNDKLVYSNFFGGADAIRNVQSVTKSISALAIGILLEDGKITSLDEPMSKWIPQWKNEAQKSRITLRMIMSHTSGLPKGAPDFFDHPDVIDAAINTALVYEPGTAHEYSNVGATLLQPVIEQASGLSVSEFIQIRLFTPLHIQGGWEKDKAGHERTSGGLMLRTSDLIQIGRLMLDHGKFEGRQIISTECEDLLLTKSQPFFEYGLLWWLYGDSFYAKGWGGQFLIVDFKKKLIAVRTKDPMSLDENTVEAHYFHDLVSLISKWQ